MDGADMVLREGARRQALERHGLLQLAQDRGDAHRRFHITAVLHMMDLVLVIHDQRNPIGDRPRRRLRRFGLAPQIVQRPQPDRIVLNRFHDHVGVFGRAQLAILALEDGPHHRLRPLAVRQHLAPETVEHQVGRVLQVRLDGHVVFHADDRASAELLVEPQPVGVRLQRPDGIAAEGGIVGQALDEDADAVERGRLLAHALVERGADAVSAAAELGREIVEIDEIQVRRIHDERKALHLVLAVLGDEQQGAQLLLERIAQQFGYASGFDRPGRGKLLAQDGLDLSDGGRIGRGKIVGHAPDSNHGQRGSGCRPMTQSPVRLSRRDCPAAKAGVRGKRQRGCPGFPLRGNDNKKRD